MSRLTWTLYLIGTALVLSSWLGLVPHALASLGWLVATGIAVSTYCDWSQLRRRKKWKEEYDSLFTPDEVERARREILGDD